MSEKRPQVLSVRTNGVLPSPAGSNNETVKGKGSGGNSAARSGRGRGSHEKQNESSRASNNNDGPKPARAKAQNEGEKLVVRRLPPGMTQAEFLAILGSTWEIAGGKVDWFSYRPGKISTDPSKPSRPARAYLHLAKKEDIPALSDVVRGSTWEDAKSTFTNPSLIGPPSLDFSIYKKIPSNKKRTDTRQGTIDQDPEFMAFLEELANPVPLKESIDADADEDAGKTETKVTTTPLVEYLKEKKANKGKDGKDGKNAKHGRQEAGAAKGKGASKDDDGTKKRGKAEKGEKAEKPAKETVKILMKKAATEQPVAEAAKSTAAQVSTNNASDAPKSRRAGIAAAARILQRDLGLSPGSAHRRARQDAAKAEADTKTPATKDTRPATDTPVSPVSTNETSSQQAKNSPTSSTTPKSQTSGRRNRGGKNADKAAEKSKATDTSTAQTPSNTAPPVILKKKNDGGTSRAPADSQTAQEATASKASSNASAAPKNSGNKPAANQKKSAALNADGVRGFVKHANPSQGITEALLKQALEAFGTIASIEMDKRKGFAYVDFADHKSLVKAISSSPITVAQGTVQVLERKDKKPATAAAQATPATSSPSTSNGSGAAQEKGGSSRGRRGRGGGKGGGGGGGGGGGSGGSASAPASAPAQSPASTNTG